jgi:hypothetical protein
LQVFHSSESIAALARQFDISESMVSSIRSGRRHADVTGAVLGMQPPRIGPRRYRPRPYRIFSPGSVDKREVEACQSADKQAIEAYRRITAEQAIEIYRSSGDGARLARKFGVPPAVISAIRRGMLLAHITHAIPGKLRPRTGPPAEKVITQEYDPITITTSSHLQLTR